MPSDAITVQASTGMRVGELLGLCWGDVDPAGGETHAAWALTDGGPGLGVVRKATKRSDWQDVHLTDSAVSALRAHWLRPCDLAGAAPTSESALLRLFRRRRRHDPKAARAAAQPPGGSPRSFAGHPRSLPALRGHHHARRDEAYRTVGDILGNSESTLRLHYDGGTDVGKRKAIAALELGPAERRYDSP